MTKAEQNKFLKRVASIVKETAKEHNYKTVAPLIALFIIKSERGESPLVSFNNVFALKVGNSKQKEAVHKVNLTKYNIKSNSRPSDDFRVYENEKDAVESFFNYLDSYFLRFRTINNHKVFAKELENNGFIKSYHDILNTIEREKVDKYDK